ncbi:2-polyprenyl-6-methoxyphenol hydroxylase-like oxidoreductase [Archangium violaceum]|uniref:FAD-dependent oxidoreductase n=1 Tax=Archangium violaceum TaxID=83451 RepID=UPI002B2FB5D8|nr:2-polyprenyl-6-methoxyphenol hydroxylase-like oxidoreductase [Archangium violaceum]
MNTSSTLPTMPVGKHAIVYGGSMAGLLATGVLSRHFERVTLVERDRFEDVPQSRKGVPQSSQVHALLARGRNVLSEVFPGFEEDLKAAGGEIMDMTEPVACFVSGLWRPQIRCGVSMSAHSRPLLEWVVRQRVQALPNVRVVDGREAAGLKTGVDPTRISGVKLQAPGGGQEELLEGDLVVDASGRGSRTPQWLEALGYPRVEETCIHVDVVYACRLYQRPPGFEPGWDTLTLAPQLPEVRRLGTIQPIENNLWQVMLGGWLGDGPSADEASFLEFARGLPQPHLYEALRNAQPLGPIHRYRFSHNQRRHYERMSRFPEGLVVIGDAFCSFNPVYGQGMTTGALQAETLGECLRQGLAGVSQRYRQRVGKLLEVPWTLGTSGDLRLPEVEGKRPPALGLMSWYGDRFQRLTCYDEEALRLFIRVMHMLESPAAMFSPRMVFKVLTSKPDAAALNRGPKPLAAARRAQVA